MRAVPLGATLGVLTRVVTSCLINVDVYTEVYAIALLCATCRRLLLYSTESDRRMSKCENSRYQVVSHAHIKDEDM